jgi:hypothetical protein
MMVVIAEVTPDCRTIIIFSFLKTISTNCEVTASTVEGNRFLKTFGAAEF